MDSVGIFRQCLIRNEVGPDLDVIYRFEDADGVRSGKSGYSFGISQFDISNNPSAILCLRECGFTTTEIAGLKAQTVKVAPLNAKLRAHSLVVDRWDQRQLIECLTVPITICRDSGIKFANSRTEFHLADYHNQLYMSRGGRMHSYLKSLGRPIYPADIFKLKLALDWGRKRPDDVKRRFKNIEDVCRKYNI
jgi:hypothetical protein